MADELDFGDMDLDGADGARSFIVDLEGFEGPIDMLLAMGLHSVSMHPSRAAAIKRRVLRADTAPLAALACIAALIGLTA